MADHGPSASALGRLRAAHRGRRGNREAGRKKALIRLARGWNSGGVADALLIDPNTVRNHFKRYQQVGAPGLWHVAPAAGVPISRAMRISPFSTSIRRPNSLPRRRGRGRLGRGDLWGRIRRKRHD